MAFFRALGAALVAAAVTGVLASASPAAPVRPVSNHTLTTTHFMVHYYTDVNADGTPALDYSTQTDAGDIASEAEQAYATFRSWGYAAPPSDGDGLIDIYVTDLSTPSPQKSEATWDNPGPAGSSGDFEMMTPLELQKYFTTSDGMTVQQEEQQVVFLNVFYMFEFGQWAATSGSDYWLYYGPATWASVLGAPVTPPPLGIGNPDIALDCHDNLAAHQMCDPSFYEDAGFARWGFFSLLASKYGNSFMNTVLANAAAGQTGTTALSNALVAKGTTLAAVYTDYVNRYMSGTIGPSGLASARPPAYADIPTGVKTTTMTPVTVVPVNHLSARYVNFDPGDGDASHACFAATLSINVSIPSGTSSQPYFFWDTTGSKPQALDINGSTASISLPWDTCDWGTTHGWLSLPNASTSVDGATFTVSDSLTVDPTTPASATAAPTPVSIWGTTVPVPSTDVAPSIDVFGPELLKVDAKSPVIRLIVESSGPGTVNAALGTVVLGSGSLRAGENDLRFSVPKSMIASLRRSASAANTLTLTPVSPTGAATGTAVTRMVVIAAAPKAKPKPKSNAKPKK